MSKLLLATAVSVFCVACGGAPMSGEARVEAQRACLQGASAACHALVEDACAQGDSAACDELGAPGIGPTTRGAARGTGGQGQWGRWLHVWGEESAATDINAGI